MHRGARARRRGLRFAHTPGQAVGGGEVQRRDQEGFMTEGSRLIRGLEGVVAVETELCDLDGANGRLAYRGYDIDHLARHASFEEVCHLLWHGALPTRGQLDRFRAELIGARPIPDTLTRAFALMPRDTDPMRALQAAVAVLGMHDPDAADNSRAANLRKALRLTSQAATAVAAHHRVRSGQEPVPPSKDLGHAANFLYMLTGREPSAVTVQAFDASLVLYAEHEINASTFTTRVVAATLSDLHSAVAGGVGALKGTLHGGAGEAVMRTLLEIGALDNVDPFADRALAEKRRLMGFGHRVYVAGDPRRRHPEGHGRGGMPAVGPGALVRPRGEAPRQGQRGEEADPQRRLLLGAPLLLDRHPGRSVHPGDRGVARGRVDGQPHRAVRGQPSHPAARRLQGPREHRLRPPGPPMTTRAPLTATAPLLPNTSLSPLGRGRG